MYTVQLIFSPKVFENYVNLSLIFSGTMLTYLQHRFPIHFFLRCLLPFSYTSFKLGNILGEVDTLLAMTATSHTWYECFTKTMGTVNLLYIYSNHVNCLQKFVAYHSTCNIQAMNVC